MRILFACALLAACATGPAPSPAQRVAGCWVNREAHATSMRWSKDAAHPGTFLGTKTNFGIAGGNVVERYVLDQTNTGWRMCRQVEAGAQAQCWIVAEGEGGSLEGGRVFIDTGGDSLRVAVMGDGPERVIFQGWREGCR